MFAMSPSQDWSNGKILKFLDLYETERVIWDPNEKSHKIKHKVNEAWKRISVNMNYIPIVELKLKRKSLMATFLPLLKKKLASLRSGAGDEDVYQPIWFGYETMERFLGTIYDVEDTLNTEKDEPIEYVEMQSQQDDEIQYQQDVEIQYPQTVLSPLPSPIPSPSQIFPSPLPAPTSQKKVKRKASLNIDEAQNKICETLETLHQVLRDKTKDTEDECELYGKLLATKLRKYPDSMRSRLMYQIDGFLMRNPCPNDRPLRIVPLKSLRNKRKL